jgi:hypothetical protein
MLTIREHLSQSPYFSGIRGIRSLVFCLVISILLNVVRPFSCSLLCLYLLRFTERPGSLNKLSRLSNNCYKPITNMACIRARLCKLQKGCTWLTPASDKVGRWFSPGTADSSTNKTGRHDITEILLKVALNPVNNQSIYGFYYRFGIFKLFLWQVWFQVQRIWK